jgi:hypothetical protein
MMSSWYRFTDTSRRKVTRAGAQVPDSMWSLTYDMHKLRSLQKNDLDIAPVLKWVEDGNRPFGNMVCSCSPATRHYWNSWSRLVLQNGVFLKRDNTGTYLQLKVNKK